MSRTIRYRVTAILTAACICVGLNLPASAASPALPIGEFTAPSTAAPHEELDQVSRSKVQQAIASDAIVVQAQAHELQWDHATVIPVDGAHKAVTVPVDRGADSAFSNLTLLTDNEGNVITYTEAHFTSTSPWSGHMKLWTDGVLTQDRDVVTEVAPPNKGEYGPDGFNEAYNALNRCLANAGVPAWIIAAAGFVCTLANIPGVNACLVASGVGGYTAGKCARAAVGAW